MNVQTEGIKLINRIKENLVKVEAIDTEAVMVKSAIQVAVYEKGGYTTLKSLSPEAIERIKANILDELGKEAAASNSFIEKHLSLESSEAPAPKKVEAPAAIQEKKVEPVKAVKRVPKVETKVKLDRVVIAEALAAGKRVKEIHAELYPSTDISGIYRIVKEIKKASEANKALEEDEWEPMELVDPEDKPEPKTEKVRSASKC